MQVEQNPSALSLQEGASSALKCNFSTTMRSVQWFRQNSLGSLISLFYLAPGTKDNGRLKSTFDSKERYSTLHIRDAQLEDSGTYLCAAEAQCSQQACSLAQNCSRVFSYSPATGRLCRRLCTAVEVPAYMYLCHLHNIIQSRILVCLLCTVSLQIPKFSGRILEQLKR
ncbi:T-cell receptor alpha chain V region 2B4 [Cricetulus griseus]|nr:T-cell receptor alpha chain V region 2B4 [Cricetulus griseus]